MPGCAGDARGPGSAAAPGWCWYQSIKRASGAAGVAPCHRPYRGPHRSGCRGRAGPQLPAASRVPHHRSVPSFHSTEGREKKMKFRSNHVRINHSSALREGTFTTIIIAITPFLSPSEDGFHSTPLSSFCLFRESRAPPWALAAPPHWGVGAAQATTCCPWGPAGTLYQPSCCWGCAGAVLGQGSPRGSSGGLMTPQARQPRVGAGPPSSDPPAPTLCSEAGCSRLSPQPAATGGDTAWGDPPGVPEVGPCPHPRQGPSSCSP